MFVNCLKKLNTHVRLRQFHTHHSLDRHRHGAGDGILPVAVPPIGYDDSGPMPPRHHRVLLRHRRADGLQATDPRHESVFPRLHGT